MIKSKILTKKVFVFILVILLCSIFIFWLERLLFETYSKPKQEIKLTYSPPYYKDCNFIIQDSEKGSILSLRNVKGYTLEKDSVLLDRRRSNLRLSYKFFEPNVQKNLEKFIEYVKTCN